MTKKKGFLLLLVFLLLSNSAILYSQEIASLPKELTGDDLIAYYPFNGNAYDKSGNYNNGTEYYGVTLTEDRFGKPDSAYSFDGKKAYIQLRRPIFNNLSSWTWSGWVYQLNSSNPYIYAEGIPSTTFQIWTPSEIRIIIWNLYKPSNWLESKSTPAAFQPNQWNHLVITLDQGGVGTGALNYYVNGEFISSTIGQKEYNPNDRYAFIGRNTDGNNFFAGKLDDIRIYKRALTAEEIKQLYDEGGWEVFAKQPSVSGSVTENQQLTEKEGVAEENTSKTVFAPPPPPLIKSSKTVFAPPPPPLIRSTKAPEKIQQEEEGPPIRGIAVTVKKDTPENKSIQESIQNLGTLEIKTEYGLALIYHAFSDEPIPWEKIAEYFTKSQLRKNKYYYYSSETTIFGTESHFGSFDVLEETDPFSRTTGAEFEKREYLNRIKPKIKKDLEKTKSAGEFLIRANDALSRYDFNLKGFYLIGLSKNKYFPFSYNYENSSYNPPYIISLENVKQFSFIKMDPDEAKNVAKDADLTSSLQYSRRVTLEILAEVLFVGEKTGSIKLWDYDEGNYWSWSDSDALFKEVTFRVKSIKVFLEDGQEIADLSR